MKIGYARVSSYGQSLEVQRQKLEQEGQQDQRLVA